MDIPLYLFRGQTRRKGEKANPDGGKLARTVKTEQSHSQYTCTGKICWKSAKTARLSGISGIMMIW